MGCAEAEAALGITQPRNTPPAVEAEGMAAECCGVEGVEAEPGRGRAGRGAAAAAGEKREAAAAAD